MLLEAKARVIAINDAWRLAPFADLLYAADGPWWLKYRGVPDFAGEKWTQDKGEGAAEAAQRFGLHVVRSEIGKSVSFDPAYIAQGYNSAFQAMNLAVHFGAVRIVFLGLDCQAEAGRTHWFGDHPPGLLKASPYPLFRAAFEAAAPQLREAGVEVINCSRATALTCFRRATIEEVFEL